MKYPTIVLKDKRSASVLRKHPWVFSGAIEKILLDEGMEAPQDGAIVYLENKQGKIIGTGHFSEASIAIRILSFKEENIDQSFWLERITNAFAFRRQMDFTNNSEGSSYRLIHAEGDACPGLVIDFYANCAVVQCHSMGMYKSSTEIVEALKTACPFLEGIYLKHEGTLNQLENADSSRWEWKSDSFSEEVIIKEHGISYRIDVVKGQKTGFFIDQRENRKRLRDFVKGKTVLNTFCYSGGFSLNAIQAGADLVHSVDSSAKAIDLVNKNLELNF